MLRKCADANRASGWEVRLVDLEWAGFAGRAVYPAGMTPHGAGIPWHTDARPGEPLQQEHDRHMFEKLF